MYWDEELREIGRRVVNLRDKSNMEFKGDTSGLDELEKRIEMAYINRLVEAGEMACQEAIKNGDYEDVTGNLRSSMGYVIAYDGRIIKEGGFHKVQGHGANMQKVEFTTKDGKNVSFWAKGKFGDGSEGSKKGLEFAHSKISSSGYSFVLVAGMEYASYVSSKGYDVLDSGTLMLWKLIK